jgi:hypothetical protein
MRTTMIALGSTALLFSSALLVWPFAGLVRRRRANAGRGHPGRGALLAAVSLCLAFLVGFGWSFSQTDFQEFFKGVPAPIGLLLALPLLAIPPTVLTVFASVRASQTDRGSVVGRIHYSLVSAALVAFLLVLNNWNLLGWRY